MKNLPLLYCGILFMLIAPWCGLILGSSVQLGSLQPGAADEGGPAYPKPNSGLAGQGREVYVEMGCVYCHTQQPRPASAEVLEVQTVKSKTGSNEELAFVSPDIARNWAKRGAVPRDYIYDEHPLLGMFRNGPDLANIGARAELSLPSSIWHYQHLYDPQITSKGSMMPPFRFLFKMQKIGDHPSPLAITLPASEPIQPPPGYELVPTERAIALVAYLRGLNQDYELPEVKFAHSSP